MKLNYRGDRRRYDPKHIVGPTWMDDMLIPVDAEYDEASDTTAVRFETVLASKLPRAALGYMGDVLAERQRRLLFLATMGHRDSIDRLMRGDGNFMAAR